MRTYADALGAMRAWINSRTDRVVGVGMPLQLGAHLKKLQGGEPATYAFLEEQFSSRSADAPESPDMMAALSAQVYGGTREAATAAAVTLAEELSDYLDGSTAATVVTTLGNVRLLVGDDIQGPSWIPDGDLPRLVLNFTVRMQPV